MWIMKKSYTFVCMQMSTIYLLTLEKYLWHCGRGGFMFTNIMTLGLRYTEISPIFQSVLLTLPHSIRLHNVSCPQGSLCVMGGADNETCWEEMALLIVFTGLGWGWPQSQEFCRLETEQWELIINERIVLSLKLVLLG